MKPQLISTWIVSITIALTGSLATALCSPVEAQPTVSNRNQETLSESLPFNISDAVVTLQGAGGKGTGSIIEASGIVLTSEHIISDAQGGQVSILTADGVQYPGKVIAVDRDRDLALIQILSRQTFSTLPLADGEEINTEERVYALADPFLSLENLTSGKLKKITRATSLYSTILLSPGDSGGPLLNGKGEIIGVNRAFIRFQNAEGNSTWGLSTHINSVHNFLENARSSRVSSASENGNQTQKLGITVAPNTLEIIQIEPDSLADEWGLKIGDELVGFNHRPIEELGTLQEFLEKNPSEVLLFLRRNNYLVRLRMRL